MLKEASGPINFNMFLNMFGEKLSGTDAEETTLNAFKMLDPDGKGSIHKDYIRRLLMSQADEMTANEVWSLAPSFPKSLCEAQAWPSGLGGGGAGGRCTPAPRGCSMGWVGHPVSRRGTPALAPPLVLQGLSPTFLPPRHRNKTAWSPAIIASACNSPASCGLGDTPTPSHSCLGPTLHCQTPRLTRCSSSPPLMLQETWTTRL
ncbi:myosin light chain 5 isoform X1 [Sus scrofa]|uniref:myosin light chain 5 isoform X1 n=1 Tax=Sus scrofa TaxID=9823 RepID=UPI000A2B02E3|nr:myosin light chain 5 isoform X1 [Sus scrofa]